MVVMAIRPAFPLAGAWASAGIAGTWAGEVDGITPTTPAPGAGADIPITAAATGVPTPTTTEAAGDTAVAITAIIRAMATTATEAL